MTLDKQIPKVLFNASVTLAGLKVSSGGSAKLLSWIPKRRIEGLVSELIYDEAIRNAENIELPRSVIDQGFQTYFPSLIPAPPHSLVERFNPLMIDESDAHLFATYIQTKCNYLVSHDKHHILALEGKIRGITIVSTKQLIAALSKHR